MAAAVSGIEVWNRSSASESHFDYNHNANIHTYIHVVCIQFNPFIFQRKHHIKKKEVVGGGRAGGGLLL